MRETTANWVHKITIAFTNSKVRFAGICSAHSAVLAQGIDGNFPLNRVFHSLRHASAVGLGLPALVANGAHGGGAGEVCKDYFEGEAERREFVHFTSSTYVAGRRLCAFGKGAGAGQHVAGYVEALLKRKGVHGLQRKELSVAVADVYAE